MKVHVLLDQNNPYESIRTLFRVWLGSNNKGNPDQRDRLAKRMELTYNQNIEFCDTRELEELYQEAQW